MKNDLLIKKSYSDSGYTIIELIITLCISIIVIGTTISFSLSFFDSVKLSSLDTRAENICVILQKQITSAISNGYNVFSENDGTPSIFKIDENNLNHSESAAILHGTNDIIYLKGNVFEDKNICDSTCIDVHVSDFFIVEIDPIQKRICAVLCSDSDKLYDIYNTYAEGTEVIGLSKRDLPSRKSADIKIGYFATPAFDKTGNDLVSLTPKIEIFNRDDIYLTVKTALPKDIDIDAENICNNLALHLVFTGKSSRKEIVLDTNFGDFQKNENSAEYTLQITEKENTSGENVFILRNQNEIDVVETTPFETGEDVEVSAELLYNGPEKISISYPNVSASFNTLYSYITTDKNNIKTAYINCGRHLQNVGRSADITKYVICNDINWNIKYCYHSQNGVLRTDDNGNFEKFSPLNGKNISSFDGRGNKIENIYIDSEKNSVGLFSEIGSPDSQVSIIKNCLLVNASICFDRTDPQNINQRTYIGALAGKIYNSEIISCSSYRTSAEKSSLIQFGDTCGGLIGKLSNSSVLSSFSSISLIESSDDTGAVCGGLIGESINSSVSECYAYTDMIRSSGNAGGFIGNADASSAITCCYSVAGISSTYSAGFISSGCSSVNSCYAVIRLTENSQKNDIFYGFAPAAVNVDSNKVSQDFPCCYLIDGDNSDNVTVGSGKSITYKELSDVISTHSKKWVYTSKELSHLFEIDKTAGEKSESYPFPIIRSIGEYRGWWPVKNGGGEDPGQSGFISFTYYEIYQNGDIGISFTDPNGNKIDTLKYSMSDIFVFQDGYAAITDYNAENIKVQLYNISADIKNAKELSSFVSENLNTVTELNLNYSYEVNRSENKYALYPLPYNTLTANTENFYKYIILKASDSEETSFLFSADFADTVISVDNMSESTLYPLPAEVYIRSPRHLVALGRNSIKNELYLSKQLNYLQTIDIDFSVYTTRYNDCLSGTEIDLIPSPIGSSENPFSASFNGNNFKIQNLLLEYPQEDYVGLFGAVRCSSNEIAVGKYGYVSNVRLVDPSITGRKYVGSLVGAATLCGEADKPLFLNNCGVYLSSGESDACVKGDRFSGGLIGVAGRESFTLSEFDFTEYEFALSTFDKSLIIANCFSAVPVYGQNDSEYIGGFIGLSSSNIYHSYSSGSVSGEQYVGGFAGAHIGTLDNGKIYYCYSSSNVLADLFAGTFVGRYGIQDSTISYSYSVGTLESNDTLTAVFYGNIEESFAVDMFDCIFLVNESSRDKFEDILGGERDYYYFSAIRDEEYSPDAISESFYYYILPNKNIKSYPYSDTLKNKSYPFAMIGEIRPYGMWGADSPVEPEIAAIPLPHYGNWPQE